MKKLPSLRNLFELIFLILALPIHAAVSSDSLEAHTNRLIHEKSPYLLQHAHNPVDWYPWGEEAFAKARKENKPIFLSVGYSTCHWCHVMERESFENPKIAAFMNDHFVSIKVDREERPDIDSVYMTFVQAITGSGGWPMSVWLTPELKPFVGGTYFPPEDGMGRPGFLSVLQRIAEEWQHNESKIREQAGQITGKLQQFTEASKDSALSQGMIKAGLRQLENRFDSKEGGFSATPKFPQPSELIFLLNEAARLGVDSKQGKTALEMVSFTLEKMAAGGIHDHLGGGFHRYSTDGHWHVPHFEKMLYDQGQLAEVYLIAYQITGRELFADTARNILDYVLRDMTSPEGAFYSAEDADSLVRLESQERAEGAFYVWTTEEIQQALGNQRAAEFNFVYSVEPHGNTSDQGELSGKNVLIQRHTIMEAAKKFALSDEEMKSNLAVSRNTLLELRSKRPRPRRDDKVITAWNGLMISAFAKGYQVLGDERYLAAANRSADFLKKNLTKEEGQNLLHDWKESASNIAGFASDYATVIRGLIDLYEVCFDTERLAWAITLQHKQDQLFWDEKGGGYFSSPAGDSNVLFRIKEDSDAAEPSPATLSALNQIRFSHLLGDPEWTKKATRILNHLSGSMQQSPLSMPLGLIALDDFLSPGEQIVIVGKRDAAETSDMVKAVWQKYLPGSVWVLIGDAASRTFFSKQAEFYGSVQSIHGKTTAYVCKNFVCTLPTSDLGVLKSLLSKQP